MKATDLFDVRGHVAVVTGAASGIGLAMAETMAENGARVALIDMDAKRLGEVEAVFHGRGFAVESIALDVTDATQLRTAIDRVADTHGRLDSVFANAGVSAGPGASVPQGRLVNVQLEGWKRLLDANLTSVLVTMQAAAVHMIPRHNGRIVVTASIAGLRGEAMVGYAYAATKAAVANLVRQAAIELGPHNVLINAIAPGPFRTNIGAGRMHQPETERIFAESVPLGRVAETREIKGLALLLASPASSYMTGAVIPVDGGALAW